MTTNTQSAYRIDTYERHTIEMMEKPYTGAQDLLDGWFLTEQEARDDYEHHKIQAAAALDKIQNRLNELSQELGFYITYGLEASCISIERGGYTFWRDMD